MSEDIENNNDGFTIHDELKLNVVRDEETEAKKPKNQDHELKENPPRLCKEKNQIE